jgi:hypothetical protein
VAEAGEGALADGAENAGITPFAAVAAGAELPFDEAAGLLHLAQHGDDRPDTYS